MIFLNMSECTKKQYQQRQDEMKNPFTYNLNTKVPEILVVNVVRSQRNYVTEKMQTYQKSNTVKKPDM